MNPKRLREKNRELLDYVTTLPCLVCRSVPSDPDHITTRGAGGGDTADNVWPLCREHHSERHARGLVALVQKHLGLQIWLEQAGRFDILNKAGVG